MGSQATDYKELINKVEKQEFNHSVIKKMKRFGDPVLKRL